MKKNSAFLVSLFLGVSGILYIYVKGGKLEKIVHSWSQLSLGVFFSVAIVLFTVQIIAAWRSKIILEINNVNKKNTINANLNIQLVSIFLGHIAFLPAFSEVAKTTLFKINFDLSFLRSLKILILERIAAAIGYIIIGLIVSPLAFFLPITFFEKSSPITIWFLGTLFTLFCIRLSKWKVETKFLLVNRFISIISEIEILVRDNYVFFKLVIASLFQLLMTGLAFYFLARNMNIEISPLSYIVYMPLIVFFSSLPVFYMGWGGREAAFILTIGVVDNLDLTNSVALTSAFGAITFFVSLPGLFLLMNLPVKEILLARSKIQ